jgi:hypothetical protein
MPWAERSFFLIQRFSARCIDRDIADERAGMSAGLAKNAQTSVGLLERIGVPRPHPL